MNKHKKKHDENIIIKHKFQGMREKQEREKKHVTTIHPRKTEHVLTIEKKDVTGNLMTRQKIIFPCQTTFGPIFYVFSFGFLLNLVFFFNFVL